MAWGKEKSVAGGQAQQPCDIRIVFVDVARMDSRKKSGVMAEILPAPDIPTVCVTRYRMTQAVDWQLSFCGKRKSQL